MSTALEIAEELIRSGKVRETHGKNRSPLIDKMVKRFGGEHGQPYCAYGVSYCFYEAKDDLREQGPIPASLKTFPYSGGTQTIRAAFDEMDCLFTDPNRLLRCKGALFGWTNPGGKSGHIGEIGHRFTHAGKVVAIGTYEFNTNLAGSRDGEGGYYLRRTIADLRRTHPNFWFCDTSQFIGGSWWP